MSMTDPIADMLTRIRNAIHRRYEIVEVPASRLKLEITRILKEERLVRNYELVGQNGQIRKMISIQLRYVGRNYSIIQGLQRISRPGRRVYVAKNSIPTVRGGIGLAIVSTSQGIMTGRESRRRHIGGEVLCVVS